MTPAKGNADSGTKGQQGDSPSRVYSAENRNKQLNKIAR
jgi:hypothetical protein